MYHQQGDKLINLLLMLVRLDVITDAIDKLNLSGVERVVDWIEYVNLYEKIYRADSKVIVKPKYVVYEDDLVDKEFHDWFKHHLQARLRSQSQVPSQPRYRCQTPSFSELDSS